MSEITASAAPAAPVAEVLNSLPQEQAAPDAEATDASSDEGAELEALEQESKKAEPASSKKKFNLKVDGEDIEEEIDLSDEEALKRQLQLAKVSQKRMQETAMLKKDIASFLDILNKDTKSALKQLGIDFDGLAQSRVEEMIKEFEKSPEQVEREKMQKELEDLRKEKEDAKKAAEEAEMRRMQDDAARQLDEDITNALNDPKISLPKTPWVVKRISELMLFAMDSGFHKVKAEDVVPIAMEEFKKEYQNLLGKLPDEMLEKVLGKDVGERLRKRRISQMRKAKTTTANQIAQSTGQKAQAEEPTKKRISDKDFFRKLGKE